MPKIVSQQPVFSHSSIEDDIKNLKHSLSDCLKHVSIQAPKDSNQPIRILNLACGRADETGILFEILGGKSLACELLGVDIRAREIREANQRWQVASKHKANFIVHDGTKIDEIQEVKEKFDYAFMRHQNFWNGDLTWFKIYDKALHSLKENGHLIITSYFDREHLLAIEAIQSLGAKLQLTWENPRSRMIDKKYAKAADKHIAIFSLS